MPPYRLSVIVINYRTPDLVLGCLESLAPQVDASQDHVVVVDNDSGDGSIEAIEKAIASRCWSAWTKVVRSPLNGGFSWGNNLGIRAAEAEAYLLLNSDTIVRPGALEELRRAMAERPDAGVIGPRLEDPDGTPQVSCFRDRTALGELIGAAATGPVTRLLRRYEVALPVSDGPMEPHWVSFAAAALRRRTVEQVGPLDEGYFMYLEDVDYCRRARDEGWRVLYWPAARVVHLRGGSSPVKRLTAQRRRLPRYYYESRSRYFAKHQGVAGLWAANLCWMAGRAISLLREVVGERRPHCCAAQWRDNWTNWLSPMRPPRPARRVP
jgi:hypothetical protein